MRRALLALVFLAVLLVVADRSAAALGERALSRELQRTADLAQPPEVSVTGFPFLTQALRGRYDRVEVRAEDVPAGDTTLSGLDAVLSGVRVPLSDVLSDSVEQVPVQRLEARVLLSYDGLSRRSLDRELTVSPAGDRVRVTGSVQVLGRELEASAVSTVTLEDDEVVVSAESFEVGNETADRLLTRALRGRLDLNVPVGGLPYGLQVQSLGVTPDGIAARALAQDTVLTTR